MYTFYQIPKYYKRDPFDLIYSVFQVLQVNPSCPQLVEWLTVRCSRSLDSGTMSHLPSLNFFSRFVGTFVGTFYSALFLFQARVRPFPMGDSIEPKAESNRRYIIDDTRIRNVLRNAQRETTQSRGRRRN
jgi:hypothetical protein